MKNTMKFGRRLSLPSTIQIKHQLLTFWLKEQTEKEAAEARASAKTPAALPSAVAVPRVPE